MRRISNILVFTFLLLGSVSTANAGWKYGLTITNLYIHSDGNIYVQVDGDLSPACTYKWILFSPDESKFMDRTYAALLAAYMGGKKIAANTSDTCLSSGHADGVHIQLTESASG